MATFDDYYALLRVPHNATKQMIEFAYHDLRLTLHDFRIRTNNSPISLLMIKGATKAYSVLITDRIRREYIQDYRDRVSATTKVSFRIPIPNMDNNNNKEKRKNPFDDDDDDNDSDNATSEQLGAESEPQPQVGITSAAVAVPIELRDKKYDTLPPAIKSNRETIFTQIGDNNDLLIDPVPRPASKPLSIPPRKDKRKKTTAKPQPKKKVVAQPVPPPSRQALNQPAPAPAAPQYVQSQPFQHGPQRVFQLPPQPIYPRVFYHVDWPAHSVPPQYLPQSVPLSNTLITNPRHHDPSKPFRVSTSTNEYRELDILPPQPGIRPDWYPEDTWLLQQHYHAQHVAEVAHMRARALTQEVFKTAIVWDKWGKEVMRLRNALGAYVPNQENRGTGTGQVPLANGTQGTAVPASNHPSRLDLELLALRVPWLPGALDGPPVGPDLPRPLTFPIPPGSVLMRAGHFWLGCLDNSLPQDTTARPRAAGTTGTTQSEQT